MAVDFDTDQRKSGYKLNYNQEENSKFNNEIKEVVDKKIKKVKKIENQVNKIKNLHIKKPAVVWFLLNF